MGNPAAPDEQPVGIDPNWRTRYQGAVVLPFGNLQRLRVFRQGQIDSNHLVSQRFVQDVQVEDIPLFQLVQVGEQFLAGHAGVAGEHAVGALPTHRQGAAQQMPDSLLQGICFRTMVNGKIDFNLGNLHIPHNAIPRWVQLVNITF